MRNAVRDWLITPEAPWNTNGLTLVDGVVYASPSQALEALGAVQALSEVEINNVIVNAIQIWITTRIVYALEHGVDDAKITPRFERAQFDRKYTYASALNYKIVFDWIEDVGNS